MSAVLVTGPTVMQNSPFSSITVAITVASTHFAYSWRDGQAELASVAWLNTKTVYLWMVTHLSINPTWCRITLLMCPTMLPLSQNCRLCTALQTSNESVTAGDADSLTTNQLHSCHDVSHSVYVAHLMLLLLLLLLLLLFVVVVVVVVFILFTAHII